MRIWSRIRSWMGGVMRRSRMESEMDAELRFHIETFAEDLVRSGVPRGEALRRARIEFGGVERAKEECREARGMSFIDSLLQDLRFGLRMVRKNPGFTAIAVLALALGIGVNTTVFTAFDAVALRPRAVKDPDHLVGVYRTAKGVDYGGFSYPDYAYYRDHSKSLSDFAMFSGAMHVTTSDLSVASTKDALHAASALGFRMPQLLQGGAQLLNSCAFVSGNYFQLLGARPAAGRLFLPEDNEPGAPPVVVLSGNFWQSQLHSEPKIVGSTIHLDRVAFTIIGVAPVDFLGTLQTVPVLWAPITARPLLLGDPTQDSLENRNVPAGTVYGHLKDGVSLSDAQAELSILAAQLRAAYPEAERDFGVRVVSEREPAHIDSDTWPIVAATMGAVALLLLIACANVASLLLARSAARRREIGVRLSLGAGRRRLLQQLLIESTLIALFAGAVGLPLASWTLHLLVVEIASAIPSYWGAIALKVTPDIRIFGYTVLISLLTGMAFGLTPALQALRTDVNSALKDNGSMLGQQVSKSRLRDLLIVAQVAACLVLLINSALLLRGSQRALRVDPGFDAGHVVHLSLVNEPVMGYAHAHLVELNRQLIEGIGNLPGVTAVTLASRAPISGGNRFVPVGTGDTRPPTRGESEDRKSRAGYSYIQPNYFETLGIPIVNGRTFTVQETETEAPVVVISEATARRFWPGQNPIGKRLAIGSVNGPAPFPGETAPFSRGSEVIGVVRDVHSLFLGKVDESYLYLPHPPTWQWTDKILVRTSGSASSLLPALGGAVRRVDANLPVAAAPLDWMVSFDPYFVISRIGGVLSSIVGTLGLFLACLGVYGMVSYSVVERTHEIGVRMALGARPPQVLGLVLRESARPMVYGTVVGIAVSAVIARLLSAMLFGLNPMDAISFAGVSVLLIAVALFASWLPARRATRVDPMVALRYE